MKANTRKLGGSVLESRLLAMSRELHCHGIGHRIVASSRTIPSYGSRIRNEARYALAHIDEFVAVADNEPGVQLPNDPAKRAIENIKHEFAKHIDRAVAPATGPVSGKSLTPAALTRVQNDNVAQQTYSRLLLSLLASARDITYHAQNAHWTVKSESFAEHHKFFGDAYEMFWEMQDTLAEHIRAYDISEMIPNNPDGLRSYSQIDIKSIEAQTGIGAYESRFQIHLSYYAVFLDKFISMLKRAYKLAESEVIEDFAGSTLFGDLLRATTKQRWQVRSFL